MNQWYTSKVLNLFIKIINKLSKYNNLVTCRFVNNKKSSRYRLSNSVGVMLENKFRFTFRKLSNSFS